MDNQDFVFNKPGLDAVEDQNTNFKGDGFEPMNIGDEVTKKSDENCCFNCLGHCIQCCDCSIVCHSFLYCMTLCIVSLLN